MWDSSSEKTFTKTEAAGYVGRTVATNARIDMKIVDTFCVGRNQYVLIGDKGAMIYKSHNNCVYLVP